MRSRFWAYYVEILMGRLTRFSWIAILAAIFMPTMAFAQATLMPDATDKSVAIFLNQLFGSLVDAAGGPGGGVDPLASSISRLNELVLLVGGILLAYTLIAGTMQTAHDGEMLGKKWSSMWTPIRTSLGIAAIVPYINGYAIIQVIVMWLVLQGVGGANLVWNTYISLNTSSQNQSPNSTNVAGLTPFAENMLKTLVCTYTVESKLFGLQGDGAAYVGNSNYQGIMVPQETTNGTTGAKRWTADGFGETGCGGYDPSKSYTMNLTSQFLFPADPSAYQADIEPIQRAHEVATRRLVERLKPMARAIAYSNEVQGIGYKDIANYYKMQTYIDEYKGTVLTASANSLQTNETMENIKRNIARDGWVTAGAWYVEWSKVNAQIRAQIGNMPAYTAMTPSVFESSGLGSDINTNINTKLVAVLKEQNYTDRFGVVERNDTLTDVSSVTQGDPWNKISGWIFGSKWINDVQNSNRAMGVTTASFKDPIIVAESLGSTLVAGSATALAASAITGNTILKALTVDLQLLIFSIALPMMIFAMTLAYYIPFIPFIVWFGGVVGWLVMVVEAIIAAPLWAVAHLHPDGDGVVGRGGQGYSLVLSLVLRPALMIVGLAASMVLMLPIGFFLHSMFLPAFELSQGGAASLFGLIALVAIYTTFLVNIITKVVGLMHVIPDQILRWMGGPSSDLGSYGQQANQGMQAAAGAFLGASGSKIIEGARGMQQVRASRAGADAQLAQNEMQQRKIASEASSQMSGMESTLGSGYGMAHGAGQSAQEKAEAAATKKLMAGDKNRPNDQKFENMGANEKSAAIWKQVKADNVDKNIPGHNGYNPSEIYDAAAKKAYNSAQAEDAARNVPRMDQAIGKNESFTDRLKAVQASKAPPVQPHVPPTGQDTTQ